MFWKFCEVPGSGPQGKQTKFKPRKASWSGQERAGQGHVRPPSPRLPALPSWDRECTWPPVIHAAAVSKGLSRHPVHGAHTAPSRAPAGEAEQRLRGGGGVYHATVWGSTPGLPALAPALSCEAGASAPSQAAGRMC